jgi:hypothetical protein
VMSRLIHQQTCNLPGPHVPAAVFVPPCCLIRWKALLYIASRSSRSRVPSRCRQACWREWIRQWLNAKLHAHTRMEEQQPHSKIKDRGGKQLHSGLSQQKLNGLRNQGQEGRPLVCGLIRGGIPAWRTASEKQAHVACTWQLARIRSPRDFLSSFFARAARLPCFRWCQPAGQPDLRSRGLPKAAWQLRPQPYNSDGQDTSHLSAPDPSSVGEGCVAQQHSQQHRPARRRPGHAAAARQTGRAAPGTWGAPASKQRQMSEV